MEIDAQDQPFAIPRHGHGRTLAGQRLSHETVAKLQDKTFERTRLLTLRSPGRLRSGLRC